MPDVLVARAAEKDLRRLGPGPHRKRIAAALTALEADVANLDVKTIVGSRPGAGSASAITGSCAGTAPTTSNEVARIVRRRDLDASAAALPPVDQSD